MKLKQSIQVSLWLMILLNTVMGFIGIWAFIQLVPIVEKIAETISNPEDCLALRKGCLTGAWLMVIMSFAFFIISLGFLRTIKRLLLKPLANITDVIKARLHGDRFRRCPKSAPNQEITSLYNDVNQLLDKEK